VGPKNLHKLKCLIQFRRSNAVLNMFVDISSHDVVKITDGLIRNIDLKLDH
jgi:hypothetical protein